MSAIIPFIEGCFIISHDATIHPIRSEAGGSGVDLGAVLSASMSSRHRRSAC